MQEAINIALLAVVVVSLLAILEASFTLFRLHRRLESVLHVVPRDDRTGLSVKQSCLPRLAADIKRARRMDGNVWIGVATVVAGDTDRFGRLASDSLRYPEVGFRLSENVFCFVCQDTSRSQREDLIRRLTVAGPRESISLGEAWWSPQRDVTPAELLTLAISAGGETRE